MYKIVCQGYGLALYEDLLYKKIDIYIDKLNDTLERLKVCTDDCVNIINDCPIV